MTAIRFYHVQTQTLEQALPALITKAYEGGHKIWVRVAEKAMAESLSAVLWTKNPGSFIPHGTEKDGNPAHQPIWISAESDKITDNQNEASTLILAQNITMEPDALKEYDLCCKILDGNDEAAVSAARERWKSYKDAGLDVTYWQQNERGGWDQKA